MRAIQIKMARAAVGWGVRELAKKAGVTANTVTRIENGADARQSTIDRLQQALEAVGVSYRRERGRSWSAATKAASEEELDRRPPLDRSATGVEFPDDLVSRSRSRPPANQLAGMGLRIYRRD